MCWRHAIYFLFPDSSNIRGGTFKMNCYGEYIFGHWNNKVIMPMNKAFLLLSKKITI